MKRENNGSPLPATKVYCFQAVLSPSTWDCSAKDQVVVAGHDLERCQQVTGTSPCDDAYMNWHGHEVLTVRS